LPGLLVPRPIALQTPVEKDKPFDNWC